MGKIQAAAERARKHRRVDPVELENLFGDRLVLPVQEPARPGARDPLPQQLEIRGNAVVSGVVSAERFREIEDEIAVDAGQRVKRLRRSVEQVQRRVVSELAQRFRDFVLDFFLVERAGQRPLVRGWCIRLVGFFPAIVKDDDVQFAHGVAGL